MRIHIVSSFHYDYLYLRGSEEYFQTSFRILDEALLLLEKEKDWCFTVEQGILLEEYLRRFPEKKDPMRRFAKEGRLVFAPGMYVMPDMNMTDGESLCLLVKYGKKFLRDTLGADPKACWIADCWGHHAQLPQLLKSCGYEGYFFWRCMRRDLKKNDFFWRGLDGTGIPVHWLSLGYACVNFPFGEALCHAEELSFAEGSAEKILEAAKKAFRHSREGDPVLLCNGGDFRMPQKTGPEIVRNLGRLPGYPEIFFSTPEKFLEEMKKKTLPEVSGEFNGTFQGTYSSNISIKQLLFRTRTALLARETFSALTGAQGVSEETWKRQLRHCFHDTVCGTICDDALKEVQDDLRSLEKSLSGKGPCLFNPLLREREEVLATEEGRRLEVKLAPLESRQTDSFEEMPPLREEKGEGSFENRFFRCSWAENGRIVSLRTKGGLECVDRNSAAFFGLPVMQMDCGDNWIYYETSMGSEGEAVALTGNYPDPLYLENAPEGLLNRNPVFPQVEEWKIFRSERECVIFQKGFLRFWKLKTEYSLQIAMDDFSPLLRYTLNILPQGKHFRLRSAFPTPFAGGKIHHGIPCGFQKRPSGEFPAEGWIHLGDPHGGIFLLNRGLPGNNADENGVLLLSLFRSVAMEYKCDSAGSFQENVPHTFEYAVLPHDGGLFGEENASCMENYLRPAVYAGAAYKGEWKALPANVRLLSLRKHGCGLFLRLCEVWGQEALYMPPCPYLVADALEEPLSSEKTASPLRFRPFELKNIVLVSQSKDPS